MYLKRLTVRGFKSFADRTHFDFASPLTGIVGPNGCGKSNVVDALKWVLGDQRARSLRGKEMTDVIFKGAEGRDGCHQAEVDLLLTDDQGAFGERTEVTVGRRLTKDKESDYVLNGDRVRLKDVRDVLMDTGLGVGAYSVMEQGRIDAVLSANPEDRRAIFEEAAGISRFKLQKRETLRKLDRTEQNLARVKDLLEERARRIRSLKIQAGKARRYEELRAELRDLRTAVAVVEGRELRARQAELEAALAAHQEELAAASAQSAAGDGERTRIEAEIDAASARHQAVLEELRTRQSEFEAAEHRAATHDQRVADLHADAATSAERQTELEAQHAEKLAARDQGRDRIAELEAGLVALAKDLDERRTAVKAAQAEHRDLQARREFARRQVLERMNERTRARNAAHERRSQIDARDARRLGLEERAAQLDAELTRLEIEACSLAEQLGREAIATDQLAAEEQIALAELAAADGEAAALAQAESELRQKLSAVEGRRHVLAEMEAHMEGLDLGPRFLLEQNPPGLQGRLLDLVDTDLEHSAALEAALGPYVQALVVDSRQAADAMHDLLAERGKGRALLLIEREIPDNLLKERPLHALPEGARSLASVVRFPGHARCLVHWLLRGVCLIDDVARAEPRRHDLCFVTPQGGLVCGPRIEGGSREGQGGLVVRKARLQVLELERRSLQAGLDALLAGKQNLAERVEACRTAARELGMLLQSERARGVAGQHSRAALLVRVASGERDLAALQLEIDDLARQRTAAITGLADVFLRTFLLQRAERRDTEAEAAIAAALIAAQQRMESAARADQEIELEQVRRRSDRQAALDAVRLHEQALRELAETTQSLIARREQDLRQAEDHAAKAATCRSDAAACRAAIDALGEQRDASGTALAAARQAFAICKQQLQELQARTTELTEAVTKARLERGELQHRFEWLESRLHDEVGIALRRSLGEIDGLGHVCFEMPGPLPDPASPVAVELLLGPVIPLSILRDELELRRLWEAPDFHAETCQTEAKIAQSRIERLGSVNLDAVAELEDEESDFELTEKEVKDLTESRTALIEALRRMERESRTLFEETFRQARENFQAIFRKLFQGGRADMQLTEGEDSLEGGIEIVAQPPGKQLQSINLLSGGERTLTALAILFAVFKVKPSPFCILDEVDAALDDTNVERFLRVLDDFVGPTQFCIVTHHKRTMAACDMLYGITMQRRGVSSRIAVALDEVDQLTATGRNGGVGANGAAEKQRIAGEEALGF